MQTAQWLAEVECRNKFLHLFTVAGAAHVGLDLKEHPDFVFPV